MVWEVWTPYHAHDVGCIGSMPCPWGGWYGRNGLCAVHGRWLGREAWALCCTPGAGRMGSIRCKVSPGRTRQVRATQAQGARCPGGPADHHRGLGPRGGSGGSGAGAATGGALSAGRSPPHRADARAAGGAEGGRGGPGPGRGAGGRRRCGARRGRKEEAGSGAGPGSRGPAAAPAPRRGSRGPSGVSVTTPPPRLGSRGPRPGAGSCITRVRSGGAGVPSPPTKNPHALTLQPPLPPPVSRPPCGVPGSGWRGAAGVPGPPSWGVPTGGWGGEGAGGLGAGPPPRGLWVVGGRWGGSWGVRGYEERGTRTPGSLRGCPRTRRGGRAACGGRAPPGGCPPAWPRGSCGGRSGGAAWGGTGGAEGVLQAQAAPSPLQAPTHRPGGCRGFGCCAGGGVGSRVPPAPALYPGLLQGAPAVPL